VSVLADPVQDAENRESNVEVVGSQVGEFLLRCTVTILEKRAHKLAECGPMSRYNRS